LKEEGAPIENVQREDFLNAQPNAVGRRMRPRKLSPVGATALAPSFVQAIALARPISKIRQLTPPRVEREGSSTMCGSPIRNAAWRQQRRTITGEAS